MRDVSPMKFCIILCQKRRKSERKKGKNTELVSLVNVPRSGNRGDAPLAGFFQCFFLFLLARLATDTCVLKICVLKICVLMPLRFECMKFIINGKADVVNLDNEELYLAGRLYNLEPFASEQYSQGELFVPLSCLQVHCANPSKTDINK